MKEWPVLSKSGSMRGEVSVVSAGCEGGSGLGGTQWRSDLRGKSRGLPCLWWHRCQGEKRWEVGMRQWSSSNNNFYFSPVPCIKAPFWPLHFFLCHINLVKGAKIFTTITKSLQSFQHLVLACFSSHNKMPYTGWLKKQTFISHTSRGGEVQDQGGKSSLPGLQTATVLPYRHMADWVSKIPGVFCKGTNPSTRAPPPRLHLKMIIPQWPHLQTPAHWMLGLQHRNLRGYHSNNSIIFLQLFLRENFKHI